MVGTFDNRREADRYLPISSEAMTLPANSPVKPYLQKGDAGTGCQQFETMPEHISCKVVSNSRQDVIQACRRAIRRYCRAILFPALSGIRDADVVGKWYRFQFASGRGRKRHGADQQALACMALLTHLCVHIRPSYCYWA